MTTVNEDLTLMQLSYRETPSTLPSKTDDPRAADLTKRWQEMEKQGWQYLGNEKTFFGGEDQKVPANGFQAQVYRSPDGKFHIAPRSTEFDQGVEQLLKDGFTDIQLALHGNPDQRDAVIEFIRLVLEEDPSPAGEHCAGHSLGANLCQEASKNHNDYVKQFGGTLYDGLGVNGPGMSDGEWSSFGIWQDKNSDGVTDTGEYSTLDELHIASVNLQSDNNYREAGALW